ncbi:hypothetical protein E4U21_002827 [Claviceps maximensis]|nr:hypothetical protein E4U21_002827 [Claviceps maximensis]
MVGLRDCRGLVAVAHNSSHGRSHLALFRAPTLPRATREEVHDDHTRPTESHAEIEAALSAFAPPLNDGAAKMAAVAASVECLGYGKVFVWTQVIDSDGNTRLPPASGRRLSEQRQYQAPVLECRVPQGLCDAQKTQEAEKLSASPGQEALYSSPNHVGAHQSTPQASPQSRAEKSPQGLHGHQSRFSFQDAIFSHDAATWEKKPCDEDGDRCRSNEHVESDQSFNRLKLSACGTLTDPLFQDLDRSSRYYLSHFADSVCKDLVARDTPYSNPFRELIPLTNKHPLLLQILIATSAIHWSNVFRPITASPQDLADPGGYLAQLRSKDIVSRQALVDALTAKQKALGHLRIVLNSLDPVGSEVALAAMHFFVKFDLIDLDRNNKKGWRAHMKGTSSILALLTPDSGRHGPSQMLLDFVIADCFM